MIETFYVSVRSSEIKQGKSSHDNAQKILSQTLRTTPEIGSETKSLALLGKSHWDINIHENTKSLHI